MNRVDVHIIKPHPNHQHIDRYNRWFDQCLDSLKNEPVNIHLCDYSPGDIRAARYVGFSQGTCEYVSFVDWDDWVEPGIFSKCVNALDDRMDACGAFTLSNRITTDHLGEVNTTLMRKYEPWPMRQSNSLVDIHQLVVMRRFDVMRVYDGCYDDIPALIHGESWLYWEMARDKPWLPLPFIGYNWRDHPDGAHRRTTDEIAMQLRRSIKHMREIRRLL